MKWRFWNTLNPDPQLLNDEGQTYFAQVLVQYQLLPSTPPVPAPEAFTRTVADRLANKPETNRTWADLFELEKCVLKLQPEETVRRRAWALRAKYKTVASDKEYEAYQTSNPPDPKTAKIEELRADLERILDEFHWIYSFAPIREKERDSLSEMVFSITVILIIAALAFATVAYFLSPKDPTKTPVNVPILPIVITMGMIGGYISLQRRIQAVPCTGDPIVNIAQISNSRFSVYLAPVSGAVFAALLYIVFTGGLLQGPLFPTISTAEGTCSGAEAGGKRLPADPKVGSQDAQPDSTVKGGPQEPKSEKETKCAKTVSVREFVTATAPATGVQFAILLVWSFIAGFAERFVPDAIDRLVTQAAQK